MAGETNTGVVGYISNPARQFPANSITIDIFGNTFFREYSFGAGDDTGVYWNDTVRYSRNVMLFLAGSIEKSLTGKFSYGNKLRSSQSFDFSVYLPEKKGNMDTEFMESFISELEARRITELKVQQAAELKAYLSVAKLKDTQLSSAEEQTISDIDSIEWKTFNLKELYGEATRGKRLKSADRIPGKLPFVTAGEADEGISDYIGNEVQIFHANTTTIDMFGSAKYRNYEYGADDHIAVVHTEKLNKYAAIFVTAAIHKSAHNGQFNYGHNFYAKDADDLMISLPATPEGDPDYNKMEQIVSAIHKLAIRDVDAYSKRRIEATEKALTK